MVKFLEETSVHIGYQHANGAYLECSALSFNSEEIPDDRLEAIPADEDKDVLPLDVLQCNPVDEGSAMLTADAKREVRTACKAG